MRPVAVVASSIVQHPAMEDDTEVEFMVPLISDVKQQVGFDSQDFGFVCSGSSDFLSGQAFSFVHTLDAVGAVPPISESHVEMDGAWALYEAWVKLQLGEVDTALVYSYGKASPGSLKDVLATQLDPYYVTPLWPDAVSLAALGARAGLDSGAFTRRDMAEVAARSMANAQAHTRQASTPQAPSAQAPSPQAPSPKNTSQVPSPASNLAVRSGNLTVDEVLAAPETVPPFSEWDCAPDADGGVAVVLAAEEKAKQLCDRPVWIRGIDHRIDAQNIGARDLTRAPSAGLAAATAIAACLDTAENLDFVELYAPYSYQEIILLKEFGMATAGHQINPVSYQTNPAHFQVNPTGGVLSGHTMMASGLMRIAEASRLIAAGHGDRALAHATSGPLLQQNLVCLLEGE